MQVKYGSYSHPINLTKVDSIITKVRNEGFGKYLVNKRLTISGTIAAATESELSAQIALLETAYSSEFRSGGLVESDGITKTPHWLDNATSYGGVRVNSIKWGGQSKAEYTTFRSFDIDMEADYLSAVDVISMIEEVEIIGTGGPRFGYVELLNAIPQKQVINTNTLVYAVQRGTAVWTKGPQSIPPPIWPNYEDVERRSLGRITIDLNTMRHSRRWSYFFTNVGPIVLPPPSSLFNNSIFSTGDNWVWGDGNNAVFYA